MSPAAIMITAAGIAILLSLLVNIPRVLHLREIASHRFVCPICGERFRVKWFRLLFVRWQVLVADKATLTCPACKSHDVCRRETSIYEEGERI